MANSPPRVLLDVGGRAVCARLRKPKPGAGSTPIVLAAGGAGQGANGEWGARLEEQLTELGPVVTYDRAGSGRSDGPQHGTTAGMAEELGQILDGLDVQQPAVVVGWSLGGFVAESYVLRYPERVAGLVFIDPTPIEPPPRTFPVQLQLKAARPLMHVTAIASRLGLFSGRLGAQMVDKLGGADGSEETADQARRLLQNPAALKAVARVQELVPRYSAELAEAFTSRPVADVPAAVITAGKRAGVPADYVTAIEASHTALAKRFPRGVHVTAERASHGVPFDDPDVIVDAVRGVLAAA